MGCESSKKTEEELQAEKDNKKIGETLREDFSKQRKVVKILLLGAGDCGKSTFAKQLSIISVGVNPSVVKSYVPMLKDNCLSGAQDVIQQIKNWEIKLPSELMEPMDAIDKADCLTNEIAEHILFMANHNSIQEILTTRGDEMVLQGGTNGVTYYFLNAKRFATDFTPDTKDILMARRKTTGVIETSFEVDGNIFTVVDVGGQRSERKKMAKLFFCNNVSYLFSSTK